MKIKTFILAALAVFVIKACGNKKSQQQATDPAIQMLTEFYTAYITEYSKEPPAYKPEAI